MPRDLEERVQRLARALLELTNAVTLLEQRERVLEGDGQIALPADRLGHEDIRSATPAMAADALRTPGARALEASDIPGQPARAAVARSPRLA